MAQGVGVEVRRGDEIMSDRAGHSRFFGIVSRCSFDDMIRPTSTSPRAGDARIRIDTLEVMDNTLGRRQQPFGHGVGLNSTSEK